MTESPEPPVPVPGPTTWINGTVLPLNLGDVYHFVRVLDGALPERLYGDIARWQTSLGLREVDSAWTHVLLRDLLQIKLTVLEHFELIIPFLQERYDISRAAAVIRMNRFLGYLPMLAEAATISPFISVWTGYPEESANAKAAYGKLVGQDLETLFALSHMGLERYHFESECRALRRQCNRLEAVYNSDCKRRRKQERRHGLKA